MNVVISVYGPDGYIRRTLDVPMRDALANIGPDEKFIEGSYDAGTTVVVDGVAKDIPPAPGPYHVYLPRLNAWVDLRAEAQRVDDMQDLREQASLTRPEIIAALIDHQLLPPAEIRQAIAGQIPDSLAAAMAGIPEDKLLHAENQWASGEHIGRLHPVILAAAQVLGLADDLVDQIFKIGA